MKRQRPENESLKRRYDNLRISPETNKERVDNIREELSKLDNGKPYIHYGDLRTKDLERRENH